VVTRFADTNNYYRLSWDAPEGALHLIKKVAGTVTSLWTDRRAFDTSHDFLLTIDAVGALISCWIDGELACAIEDSDLTAGQAGLYSASDPTASFGGFRLGPPQWSHLYRFSDESPPADGRLIDVRGGPPDPSLSASPGVDYRFAAGPGERGWTARNDVALDLRLVSADGTVEHTRRFLPATEYTPAAEMTVLRKRDGTGLFLVPAAGAPPFSPGTYRLVLVYRRDNTATDKTSPVLSQAGDTTDEHVYLDLPWNGISALTNQ
jgi:hypothetical protein